MQLRFKTAKVVNGYLCIKPNNLPAAAEFVDTMKEGAEYTATLRRQGRSLTANAYAWTLMGKLAAKLNESVNEIYRNIILEIGDNFEVLAMPSEAVDDFCAHWESNGIGWMVVRIGEHALRGYDEVAAYYGSSVYDTKQMSDLIDLVVQECREQGIETLPPNKLAAMKEEWMDIRAKQTDKGA